MDLSCDSVVKELDDFLQAAKSHKSDKPSTSSNRYTLKRRVNVVPPTNTSQNPKQMSNIPKSTVEEKKSSITAPKPVEKTDTTKLKGILKRSGKVQSPKKDLTWKGYSIPKAVNVVPLRTGLHSTVDKPKRMKVSERIKINAITYQKNVPVVENKSEKLPLKSESSNTSQVLPSTSKYESPNTPPPPPSTSKNEPSNKISSPKVDQKIQSSIIRVPSELVVAKQREAALQAKLDKNDVRIRLLEQTIDNAYSLNSEYKTYSDLMRKKFAEVANLRKIKFEDEYAYFERFTGTRFNKVYLNELLLVGTGIVGIISRTIQPIDNQLADPKETIPYFLKKIKDNEIKDSTILLEVGFEECQHTCYSAAQIVKRIDTVIGEMRKVKHFCLSLLPDVGETMIDDKIRLVNLHFQDLAKKYPKKYCVNEDIRTYVEQYKHDKFITNSKNFYVPQQQLINFLIKELDEIQITPVVMGKK